MNLGYQIEKYSWSDFIIFNQNKKISAKIDSKIKETKFQFDWEFKEVIMKKNKLLIIKIEDEYKSKKGRADLLWKRKNNWFSMVEYRKDKENVHRTF